MKSYVCLFVALFVWCALVPVIIPYQIEGQAVSGAVNEVNVDIQVRYKDEDNVVNVLTLEEYVAKALSSLMDNDSPIEALKAQAVAIRSVVCYRFETPEHDGYELCSNPEHCFSLSGTVTPNAKQATEETCGELLTYKGKAAFAVSHISSCVSTESYEAVYGKKLDYLTAVRVYDESIFKDYKQVYTYDMTDFRTAFDGYKVDFIDDTNDWIGEVEFTGGNRVYTVEVGGLLFKGSTIAKLLELPGTCFSIENSNGGFVVSCYGIGNGVGMSRYTAMLMAAEGKNYKEILDYFYKGTSISHIKSE